MIPYMGFDPVAFFTVQQPSFESFLVSTWPTIRDSKVSFLIVFSFSGCPPATRGDYFIL